MTNIKEIEILKIHPHPKNPRKELGDLTELSNSIKKNGIYQNLTVVPYYDPFAKHIAKGEYTAVIGHRRLAAANKAGLLTVPCVIADMSEAEQLSTMLAENIQRSDLSVYEQAQGIQMMFDLGESVKTVADKTGFSESTIRRRAKLLDLDKNKLKKASERNISFADYDKLDKLKTVEAKNKALEVIGTKDFESKLQGLINDERWESEKEKIISKIETFATKVDKRPDNVAYHSSYSRYSPLNNIKVPEDSKDKQYFYTNGTNYIYIYKENDKVQKDSEEEEREAEELKELQERLGKLNELADIFYKKRKEFVRAVNPLKDDGDTISDFLLFSVSKVYYGDIYEDINDIYDNAFNDTVNRPEDLIKDAFKNQPLKKTLLVAYILYGDTKSDNYHDYKGEYDKNDDLDKLYEFLIELGYEESEDEKNWRRGTYEI